MKRDGSDPSMKRANKARVAPPNEFGVFSGRTDFNPAAGNTHD
jgi:hypothetical protein